MRLRLKKRKGATSRIPRTQDAAEQAHWRPILRWLGVAVALMGIGTAFCWGGRTIMDPELFPLRHVHIEGERHNLDERDLQRLVQGYLGQNFFLLDIAALRESFLSSPWVKEVAVQRSWPDSVTVKLRERVAFGYWSEDEMVDITGERFRPDKILHPQPWPYLSGPEGHEQILMHAYERASAIVAPAGLKVERLFEDERRAWSLWLDNGIAISLGRADFAQRLQRFVDIYPKLMLGQTAKIAAVDLRYANGFAVRWKGSESPRAAG